MRSFVRPLLALAVALAFIGSGARAQTPPARLDSLSTAPRDLSPAARVLGAVLLVRDGRPADAVPHLQTVVDARPGYVHPSHGAAAFWLGAVLDTTGRTADARSVRRAGIRALDAANRVDVRLAARYLRDLTPRTLPEERPLAVRTYRRLLARIGPTDRPALRSVFRHEMAQLAPLLPDDVVAQVVDAPRSSAPETWTFRPQAGAALTQWWRAQDAMPSTPENERIEEHLARRVQAEADYSCPERPSGLDARGLAHLRLGAPWKTNTLHFNDPDFFKEVFRFGVSVSGSDFPTATLWLYTHIDRNGYFLFAEQPGGCFEIAETNDLLPPHLRHYRGTTERGLNIAYSAMMAMRYIYRELSLYHPDFAARYNEVEEYASMQEMRATQAEVARTVGRPERAKDPGERQYVVGAGAMQRTITFNPMYGERSPSGLVNTVVQEAARADRAAAEQRKEALPAERTSLRSDVPSMPVAVRTARFLTPNGQTRTEITWGVRMQDIVSADEAEAPEASLVTFSAVRYDSTYRRAATLSRRVRIPAAAVEDGRAVVSPPVSLPPSRHVAHVALQWDHYALRARGDAMTAGARRHMAVARADTLAPLRASGSLEMSDLRVLTTPDTTATVPTQLAQAVPYPFGAIGRSTPLLLGFELYHLAFDADDRTRYTVTYEVEAQQRRTWTRPFSRRAVAWTATATTASGARRRTHERILLDLSRLDPDATRTVRITVRVADAVTGATADRSVTFEVAQ